MESHTRSDFDSAIAELRLEDLEARARQANGGNALPLRDWVALAEAWRIAQALRETRGNRSAAARALGIGRRTLYSKMEKLGLEPVWMVGPSGANGSNGKAVPGANGIGHDAPEI
jgi:DNA-binding NtrC family response regulator